MKKLLFIIWSYSFGGGAETLLTAIVNHLNPEKYDISIIELYHVEIKKELTNPNIKVLPPISGTEDPELKHKRYLIYHEPEKLIEKYIRKDYDLYIAFNYQKPTFLLPNNTRNIAWIHSDVYDLASDEKIRYRLLQEKAFERVQKIVSISDITTRSLKDLFPNHVEKIVEIYNGLDIEKIRKRAEEQTEIKLEHPALMFIGRLEERKNPVRLVNILELIHKKNPAVHLYYLGQGGLNSVILEEAQQRGMADYVHLLGFFENPYPVIKQCDISCLLSYSEGFSMCLLESVALGKPFIATDIGGARILANKQQCGKIVESDMEAAEAALELMGTDKEQLKNQCQVSIERFELKQYISKIEELIEAVCAKEVASVELL